MLNCNFTLYSGMQQQKRLLFLLQQICQNYSLIRIRNIVTPFPSSEISLDLVFSTNILSSLNRINTNKLNHFQQSNFSQFYFSSINVSLHFATIWLQDMTNTRNTDWPHPLLKPPCYFTVFSSPNILHFRTIHRVWHKSPALSQPPTPNPT